MTGRVPKPVPSRRRTADAAKEQPAMSWRRHYGGFVLAGGSAFVTDAGVLQALIRYSPLGPFTARILAIAAAMVVSWAINRTVTFPVGTPPTLHEFARFATLAWGGAALNYLIYAAILLLIPQATPFAALFVASAIGTVYSYVGMRFGVFAAKTKSAEPKSGGGTSLPPRS